MIAVNENAALEISRLREELAEERACLKKQHDDAVLDAKREANAASETSSQMKATTEEWRATLQSYEMDLELAKAEAKQLASRLSTSSLATQKRDEEFKRVLRDRDIALEESEETILSAKSQEQSTREREEALTQSVRRATVAENEMRSQLYVVAHDLSMEQNSFRRVTLRLEADAEKARNELHDELARRDRIDVERDESNQADQERAQEALVLRLNDMRDRHERLESTIRRMREDELAVSPSTARHFERAPLGIDREQIFSNPRRIFAYCNCRFIVVNQLKRCRHQTSTAFISTFHGQRRRYDSLFHE